jgi:hypothetical protein
LGRAQSDLDLPNIQYGKSLLSEVFEFLKGRKLEDVSKIITKMDEQSQSASDLESTTTSETLTSSDGGPVIFCGMGRIATIQNESSAEEQPRCRKNESSGHPTCETLHQLCIIKPGKIERTLLHMAVRSTLIASNAKARKYLKGVGFAPRILL